MQLKGFRAAFCAVALLFTAGTMNSLAQSVEQESHPHAVQVVLEELSVMRPDIVFEQPIKSARDGYYEVQSNVVTVYISEDGGQFFSGELYSVDAGELISETELSKSRLRAEKLAEVRDEDMIIFSPEGETRAVLSVFTDVTCGYCRLMHSEVAEMNAQGIEIRYLAYPRSGLGAPEAALTTTAWCAEDRHTAMTALKAGTYEGESITCMVNPVASQFELGQSLGVSGTPAVFLEDGTFIRGYKPVSIFLALLELEEI